MSLAGKILAVVNLLGAIGLVYLASADYATRQAWAFSVFRQDLLIDGLPVDEQQQGEDGEPIFPRIRDEDKAALLSGVGGKLDTLTQVTEVKRVKQELDAKVEGAGQDPVQQSVLLARILLPLTDAFHEREQLIACRLNFDSPDKTKALRARLERAFKEALRPAPADLPAKAFSEAFRFELRRQEALAKDSEPAELFVSQLLRAIPDDRAKAAKVDFNQVWNSTISAQVASFKQRYDRYFDEALGNSSEASGALKQLGRDGQRTAIARLLFGLAPFLTEDAIFSDPAKQAEQEQLNAAAKVNFATFQETLVSTETFRGALQRVAVVCGLRSTMGAISERASVVRRLTDYAREAMTQERQQFVYDDLSVIELLREQASLVRAEQAVINENRERLGGYDTVVKERKKEIDLLKEDFNKMRADNAARAKKLRELSQQVLDLRVRIRDAISSNEKGEQRIRELERQAAGPAKSIEGKSIEKGGSGKSIEK
jgi:hypothetical protein